MGYYCSPVSRSCVPGCRLPSDCPSGSTCESSRCRCGVGQHGCGFACSSNTSVASCGLSCLACPVIANASATCADDGGCGIVCNADALMCNGACVRCTPPQNAAATCASDGGAACDFQCAPGYHRCGQGCVEDTSVYGCGTNSCSPCEVPANGRATCSWQPLSGQPLTCGFSCNPGATVCQRDGGTGCTTCQVPPNGVVACDDPSCTFSCAAGFHRCGDGCVWNESSSPDRCGMSCSPCAAPDGGIATCEKMAEPACGFQCLGGLKCGGACCSAVSIARGSRHTCAVTSAGGAKCWGNNWSGELGDGTTSKRPTPADVSGLASGVKAVATGGGHSCVLTSADAVMCWGNGAHGQLGNGARQNSNTPTTVSGLESGAIAISVGGSHSCALTSAGAVKCWGANAQGQLGDGSFDERLTPVDVTGLATGVVALSAGTDHTCAVKVGGDLVCWGANFYGQLGDGTAHVDGGRTLDARGTPGAVVGLDAGVVAVSAGLSHTCALTSGGAVKCWGDDTYGQLGDGAQYVVHRTPVDVAGLGSGVSAVSAGQYSTCALTSVGGAKCWGENNSGAIGDGTTVRRLTPVDVSGLTQGVTVLSAGGCAIATSGVYCWGKSSDGEVGNGFYPPSVVSPVGVSGY